MSSVIVQLRLLVFVSGLGQEDPAEDGEENLKSNGAVLEKLVHIIILMFSEVQTRKLPHRERPEKHKGLGHDEPVLDADHAIVLLGVLGHAILDARVDHGSSELLLLGHGGEEGVIRGDTDHVGSEDVLAVIGVHVIDVLHDAVVKRLSNGSLHQIILGGDIRTNPIVLLAREGVHAVNAHAGREA